MNKEVLITIKSQQSLPGGEPEEGAELITRGTYQYGKNGIRFSYMESELTGLSGTKTVFLIKPDEVVLSRKGTVNSQMVFRPGESSDFLYRTEFGFLQMGLDTKRLECSLDEHGGSMEIDYDLDFERSFLSRNTFRVDVREQVKS